MDCIVGFALLKLEQNNGFLRSVSTVGEAEHHFEYIFRRPDYLMFKFNCRNCNQVFDLLVGCINTTFI